MPNYENLNNGQFKKKIKPIIIASALKMIIPIVAILVIATSAVLLGYIQKDSFFNSSSDILGEVAVENTNNGETDGQASSMLRISNENGYGEYILDTEKFTAKMYLWFAKNNASPSTYGLKPDLSELREFFAAEIATSYPDLRDANSIGTPIKQGEIQGCVKFVRNGKMLTYITPDIFNSLFEQAKTQASDSGSLDYYNALKNNYYTLDENLNVVVANLTTTTTQVETCGWAQDEGNAFSSSLDGNVSLSIQTCMLPYKNMIQKYSTPFEFYIAMLLTTETPEYCVALANLTKNSQIIIEIQENDSTVTGVANFDYNIEYVIEKTKTTDEQEKKDNPNTFGGVTSTWVTKKSYTDEPTIDKTIEKEVTDYEKVTIIKDSSVLTLGVNLVDAWYISCEVNYQKNPKAEELDKAYTQDSEIGEDSDYKSVGGKDVIKKHEFMQDGDFAQNETKSTGNDRRNSMSYSYSLKGKIIGGVEHYTAKTETSYFQRGQTKIRETPEKFLSLLKVDPNRIINPQTGEAQFNIYDITKNTKYITYNKGREVVSPIGKLFEQRGYLYEFLSSNSKTVNYVDTVKYFLAIYEGKITPEERESSMDFSIYEPGEFTPIGNYTSRSGSYYGKNAAEKLWFMLKESGYSDVAAAAVLGNVIGESGARSNNFENLRESGDYPNYKNYPEKYYKLEKQYGIGNSKTDEIYTADIDSGEWVMEKDKLDYNLGYGLIQWTFGRKAALFEYCKKDLKVSVSDLDAQLDFLMAEITGCGANGKASKQFMTKEKEGQVWTESRWKNSNDIEEATKAFCYSWVRGAWGNSRLTNAKKYLNEFGGGKLVRTGPGDTSGVTITGTHTSTITGRTFYIFKQWTSDCCNRAAQAIVCSGYYKGDSVINSVKNAPNGKCPYYDETYNNSGLRYQKANVKMTVTDIKNQLESGGYILYYLKGSKAGYKGLGKSGKDWAYSMHWITILDYRENNGQKEIYIGDSSYYHKNPKYANMSEDESHWFDADEFISSPENVNGNWVIETAVFVNER